MAQTRGKKRKVSNEEQEDAADESMQKPAVERSTNVWFEDGNIVVVAGDTGFKVSLIVPSLWKYSIYFLLRRFIKASWDSTRIFFVQCSPSPNPRMRKRWTVAGWFTSMTHLAILDTYYLLCLTARRSMLPIVSAKVTQRTHCLAQVF